MASLLRTPAVMPPVTRYLGVRPQAELILQPSGSFTRSSAAMVIR